MRANTSSTEAATPVRRYSFQVWGHAKPFPFGGSVARAATITAWLHPSYSARSTSTTRSTVRSRPKHRQQVAQKEASFEAGSRTAFEPSGKVTVRGFPCLCRRHRWCLRQSS
jgi:hypothetical protein